MRTILKIEQLMEIGKIGIISNEFFDTCFGGEKWIYLTTVIDITDYWQKNYPNRKFTRTFYEVRYRLLESTEPFVCTAIYLENIIVPDTLVSSGNDHKMSQENTKRWKYHKVLLTIDDRTEVRYLHEKCLQYFTWYDK